MAVLNSGSSNILNVLIFSGDTSYTPKIRTTAPEKPHRGASGVPFMNKTRGVPLTVWLILSLVSVDNAAYWAKRGGETARASVEGEARVERLTATRSNAV